MSTQTLNWSSTDNLLPRADIFPDRVRIHNFRDFIYKDNQIKNTEEREKGDRTCEKKYQTREIRLDSIISASYFVVPFRTAFPPGGAHVFIRFTIENQEPIAISFEALRKPGQTYDPLTGIFGVYRLAGVVGSLHDIVTLRKQYRQDSLYEYPFNPDILHTINLQKFFVGLLTRINELNSKKESYNTIWNACQTDIFVELNKVIPQKIGWGIRTLLPGYSPSLLRKKGILSAGVQM